MKCPVCGGANFEWTARCDHCGGTLAQTIAPASDADAKLVKNLRDELSPNESRELWRNEARAQSLLESIWSRDVVSALPHIVEAVRRTVSKRDHLSGTDLEIFRLELMAVRKWQSQTTLQSLLGANQGLLATAIELAAERDEIPSSEIYEILRDLPESGRASTAAVSALLHIAREDPEALSLLVASRFPISFAVAVGHQGDGRALPRLLSILNNLTDRPSRGGNYKMSDVQAVADALDAIILRGQSLNDDDLKTILDLPDSIDFKVIVWSSYIEPFGAEEGADTIETRGRIDLSRLKQHVRDLAA